MILRRWIGYASPPNAELYEQHFRRDVLPKLRGLPGFIQAYLLRRTIGAEVELQALTLWASLDAIRSFSGPDHSKATVEPEARDVLSSFEETAEHFEIAVAGGQSRGAPTG